MLFWTYRTCLIFQHAAQSALRPALRPALKRLIALSFDKCLEMIDLTSLLTSKKDIGIRSGSTKVIVGVVGDIDLISI